MAQNQPKKPGKMASNSKSSSRNAGVTKKGARSVAPKNRKIQAQNRITKKYNAGLVAKTEMNLAQKAGHLEILKGGKKDNKGKAGK